MIRVFIIDDNVMIRYALTQLLNSETDIVVVGDAPPSPTLINEIKSAKPNLLIFDIPIPRDTGIQQLKSLKELHLPAIVFTKSDQQITRDLIPLLEYGAVGFVTKPEHDENLDSIREQLIHEIRTNGSIRTTKEKKTKALLSPYKVVAIGSSTGGPEALVEIIPHLPENFPAGIVIVQHMPPGFTTRFAARLNDKGPLPVKEAETGDLIKPGLVLLAPGDYHMVFEEISMSKNRHAQVKLTKDPPQWQLRPTVDKMMESIAPIYKQTCIGIVLTGMGEDGVIGMRAIKQNGGRTIVQDKQSSVVFGMGQEVIKNNLADDILPLNRIAGRIAELVL